ncbi:uncharacterized protein Z520_00415 [Fonsecaea multimorphosa CBS 102226]|uniref:Uncharacterized protein n=1 Tax=Fonsecaea multimorphosa CBS 102226 TaxID=1442371 RepID=A0A0D2L3T7_9EURO|nr:uncharacterized protein Z520_00415 [Fonsecaea multimorphosa CBS 102226]KIY03724.1 hypothetical protein Z520_00415 [Fonsecaea multimorphosa CBS 102226]
MSNPTKSTITTTTTTARSRQTPSQPSVTSSEPDAAQVQAILATIRANLLLVARTWGRESRQHREARGVMRAYLEENVLRHRVENRHRQRHVEDTDDGCRYEGEGRAGGVRGRGEDVHMDLDEDKRVDMQRERERERERDEDWKRNMGMHREIEEVLAELSLS